jgi:hypothetical protein
LRLKILLESLASYSGESNFLDNFRKTTGEKQQNQEEEDMNSEIAKEFARHTHGFTPRDIIRLAKHVKMKLDCGNCRSLIM